MFDDIYFLFPPLPLSVILRNDRDKPGNHGDGSEDEEYCDGYDGHNHDYDDDDDAVDDYYCDGDEEEKESTSCSFKLHRLGWRWG